MAELTGDYRQFMDKRFLGEWDLPEKGDLVVTIDHAERNSVKNERGTSEKLTVHFKGDYKPLIVNATNGEAISKALGSTKLEAWKGKKIALFRDKVSAFGKTTNAVRVRPFAPAAVAVKCEKCGADIVSAHGMTAEQMAEYTRNKYGAALCEKCATEAANA